MKFRDLMKNAFNKKGRSLQQAGAMFVEYAMALAFVIVVGVVFLSDGAMQNSIASIFGKTTNVLELASNKNTEDRQLSYKKGFWRTDRFEFDDKDALSLDRMIGFNDFTELNAGQSYYYNLNLDSFDPSMYSNLGYVGFVLYKQDNKGNYSVQGQSKVSIDDLLKNDNTKFTIPNDGGKYYMALNLENKGDWRNDPNKIMTDEQAKNYEKIIREGLTLTTH